MGRWMGRSDGGDEGLEYTGEELKEQVWRLI